MTYIYTWADAEQTTLCREDTEGNMAFVPANPANRDYAAFVASGSAVADYVAPPQPDPLTPSEKLEAAGLTVDELKELLGL